MPTVCRTVSCVALADDPQALVETAMKQLGLPNANQLAKWLGYKDDERRKVSNWVKGDHAPSYDATIALLRALGMLREEPAAASPVAPEDIPPGVEDAILRVTEAAADLARAYGLGAPESPRRARAQR